MPSPAPHYFKHRLWLVTRTHMTSFINGNQRQVAFGLEGTSSNPSTLGILIVPRLENLGLESSMSTPQHCIITLDDSFGVPKSSQPLAVQV